RNLLCRWMPFPERFVKLVEKERATLETRLVLGIRENQAVDEALDPRRLGSAEFAVFQVDVVDDLPDLRQRPIGQLRADDQRSEGAAAPFVTEVPADDVEAQLAGARRLFRVDEPEPRLRIDEPADQPGGGDAVDMDPPSRRPGPTGEMAGPSSLGGAPSA